MNKIKHLLLLLLFTVLAFSCSKENRWDCFKGNGDDTIETRQFSSFESVLVKDFFNIYLVQDSVYKIIIEGNEKTIGLIKTDLNNGTITIDNMNKCRWSRKYKANNIYVHSPAFRKISLEKESNLFSIDTIFADTFHVDIRASVVKVDIKLIANVNMLDAHAATGDFIYVGNVKNNYLYCHGTAFINCENLKSNYLGVTHQSTGDFRVNCNGWIDVKLNGTGNVYYTGDPTKISVLEKTSSGEILPL